MPDVGQPSPNGPDQHRSGQPYPVPSEWTVETLMGPKGRLLAIKIALPTGATVLFLKPDEAIEVGQMIAQAGAQASSGLVIPE